jgi:hypothetical protein
MNARPIKGATYVCRILLQLLLVTFLNFMVVCTVWPTEHPSTPLERLDVLKLLNRQEDENGRENIQARKPGKQPNFAIILR